MIDFGKEIKLYDKDSMIDSICSLSNQIRETINIADNLSSHKYKDVKNIIVCGMGGSAIGGDVVNALMFESSSIPLFVNRDYALPNWVNDRSLVIISSFSGNTEEAVSCFDLSINKGYNPIVISTGGKLIDKAISNKCDILRIPDNEYQPRAAIGYSVTILLSLLSKLEIIDTSIKETLKKTSSILDDMNDSYKNISKDNSALKFAEKIHNKFPILYSSTIMNVIAYRFRCQLAENTKILSTHLSFPEQNHNEIEAFINSDIESFIIIWFDSSYNHKQIVKRMNITQNILNEVEQVSLKPIIDSIENKIIEIECQNYHLLPLMFGLISFLDWVSFYASIINKTNPTEIPNIKQIKSML